MPLVSSFIPQLCTFFVSSCYLAVQAFRSYTPALTPVLTAPTTKVSERQLLPSARKTRVRDELAPLERQPHLRVRRRRAREQGGRRPAGSRAQRERADGDLQAGTRPRRSALSSTASDGFVRGLHV